MVIYMQVNTHCLMIVIFIFFSLEAHLGAHMLRKTNWRRHSELFTPEFIRQSSLENPPKESKPASELQPRLSVMSPILASTGN